MEKVSIIIPCFNEGKYILESIDSVCRQTYPYIEVVIIDDGSDDNDTISILSDLKNKSNLIVLHTDHIGPAGARNEGIRSASGKYILPLDADDLIEPTYIEKAVTVLDSSDIVGVVYCHADLFGERTGPWQLPEYSFENMLLDNVVFVTALFRREDWEKVGGFRTSMKHGMEDYDFWISILELGREIRQLPEVLFHYRIKPESRTSRFQSNVTIIQETYREIYYQHPEFYERYKHEYAVILRNALIEQIKIVKTYEKSLTIIEFFKKIPFAKKIIKKLLKK